MEGKWRIWWTNKDKNYKKNLFQIAPDIRDISGIIHYFWIVSDK